MNFAVVVALARPIVAALRPILLIGPIVHDPDVELIVDSRPHVILLPHLAMRTFASAILLPTRPSEIPKYALPQALALLLWYIAKRVIFIAFG